MTDWNRRQARIACAAHQLITRRIADLAEERAQLEEEVRQLRAAVEIWTAVAEHTAVSLQGSSGPVR
jgi:hypothetical protein